MKPKQVTKKFEVIVCQTVYAYRTVEVEAESRQRAITAALAEARKYGHSVWPLSFVKYAANALRDTARA